MSAVSADSSSAATAEGSDAEPLLAPAAPEPLSPSPLLLCLLALVSDADDARVAVAARRRSAPASLLPSSASTFICLRRLRVSTSDCDREGGLPGRRCWSGMLVALEAAGAELSGGL